MVRTVISTFFSALKDDFTPSVSVLTLRGWWRRWWRCGRSNIEIQERCRVSSLLHQVVVLRLVARPFRRGQFWYERIYENIKVSFVKKEKKNVSPSIFCLETRPTVARPGSGAGGTTPRATRNIFYNHLGQKSETSKCHFILESTLHYFNVLICLFNRLHYTL